MVHDLIKATIAAQGGREDGMNRLLQNSALFQLCADIHHFSKLCDNGTRIC